MEAKLEWTRTYKVRDMIDEFSSSIRNELDYRMEGRNGERIAKQFTEDPTIHVPTIYWDFTNKKVLTMEKIHGIKVNHYERLESEGYNQKRIAERIVDSMLRQILEEGFFHGDPHSGNIYILPRSE